MRYYTASNKLKLENKLSVGDARREHDAAVPKTAASRRAATHCASFSARSSAPLSCRDLATRRRSAGPSGPARRAVPRTGQSARSAAAVASPRARRRPRLPRPAPRFGLLCRRQGRQGRQGEEHCWQGRGLREGRREEEREGEASRTGDPRGGGGSPRCRAGGFRGAAPRRWPGEARGLAGERGRRAAQERRGTAARPPLGLGRGLLGTLRSARREDPTSGGGRREDAGGSCGGKAGRGQGTRRGAGAAQETSPGLGAQTAGDQTRPLGGRGGASGRGDPAGHSARSSPRCARTETRRHSWWRAWPRTWPRQRRSFAQSSHRRRQSAALPSALPWLLGKALRARSRRSWNTSSSQSSDSSRPRGGRQVRAWGRCRSRSCRQSCLAARRTSWRRAPMATGATPQRWRRSSNASQLPFAALSSAELNWHSVESARLLRLRLRGPETHRVPLPGSGGHRRLVQFRESRL